MNPILLSAFEPFDGASINPSAEVASALGADPPPAVDLETVLLPVETEVAAARLLEVWRRSGSNVVVMLGEARGSATIRLEQVAINLRDFSIPDNAGRRVTDARVVDDGPDAHFATLPIADLLTRLRKDDVPVERSLSAGAYLCNEVSFRMLHESKTAATGSPAVSAGFVHLPSLPEQCDDEDAPSMALEDQVAAVRTILEHLAHGK